MTLGLNVLSERFVRESGGATDGEPRRPTATTATVELALTGRHADVRGRMIQGACSCCCCSLPCDPGRAAGGHRLSAWPTLSSRGIDFLTSNVSSIAERAGVRQGIFGSLVLIGFVVVLAFPWVCGRRLSPGVRARQQVQPRARREHPQPRRRALDRLRHPRAVVISSRRCARSPGPKLGRSYISGGLTLAVLVMPFVIIITMEALRAVPKSIREAAYGVGATRWEVIRSHVLPYAAPGVFTGRDPVARPGLRRNRAAAAGGRCDRVPLPGARRSCRPCRGRTQRCRRMIFSWARLPATIGSTTRRPRSSCCSAPSSS